MKVLSVFLNISVLIFVAYMIIDKGLPKNDELVLILLLVTAPIASLWYILISAQPPDTGNVISLYFQRKALEEKNKIEQLKNKNNT